MGDFPEWGGKAARPVLGAARVSQALIVEAVDQAAAAMPQWLIPSSLVFRATPLIDDGYVLSLQLIALHREFAQRLAEALAPESLSRHERRTESGADVVYLEDARRHSDRH